MKTALFAAVSASTALAGALMATPSMAHEVEIKNAAARVVVIVEDRNDVGVEIDQGRAGLPALAVRRTGNRVQIDGGLSRSRLGRSVIQDCRSGPANASQPGQGASVSVRGVGRIPMEQAPLIVLRTPRHVDVTAGGAVFGSVGRGARSVEIASGGCGDWTVANVDGRLTLNVGGVSTIRAGTSRRMEANIGGSGNVIAGATGGLDIAVGGSGDVRVARVADRVNIAIGGSGDVNIASGSIGEMSVTIAGSGDVVYGGRTRDLNVAIVGSGDVRVAEATGEVSRSIMGTGNVSIGR